MSNVAQGERTAESRTHRVRGSKAASDLDPAVFMNHPSGYLALSHRNQRFRINGVEGFIAYRTQGSHHVLPGGVHARREDCGRLLEAFEAQAKKERKRLMAVQVRPDQVELFASRGYSVNQLGSTFAIQLENYSLGGKKKMQLRNKINRARKAGLEVVEVGKDIPRNAAAFEKLQAVSDVWLKDKGKKELDFMIGEIGGPDDTERRIMLVVDGDEKPIAFITYVPVWGERPGVLHDLTRRVPDAPPGAMELCNADAMHRFKDEGLEYLHFGFTPFIVDGEDNAGRNKLVAWLVQKLRQHGQKVYPANSQAAYKTKWGTDIVEHEYIAARPLRLRAMWDLLVLTQSI